MFVQVIRPEPEWIILLCGTRDWTSTPYVRVHVSTYIVMYFNDYQKSFKSKKLQVRIMQVF